MIFKLSSIRLKFPFKYLKMTLSAIYLLDMKGKVLVSRNYRGDIENNLIDKFIGLVTEKVNSIQISFYMYEILWKLLNVITLGLIQTDHMNRMITVSK